MLLSKLHTLTIDWTTKIRDCSDRPIAL